MQRRLGVNNQMENAILLNKLKSNFFVIPTSALVAIMASSLQPKEVSIIVFQSSYLSLVIA